ncbi:MAG: DNA primase [Anaerolineae bacterium]|nr:MAG: DNA primase [Anaerolineae bacterium]
MSSIEEIKARLDILDVVSETVQLKRSGKSYTGFCPFHANTRTPSFVVWPDSGVWKCFGACNEGGDIFKFVMKRDGLDFADALKALAEKAGVTLRPPTAFEEAQREEHEAMRGLLEEAVSFYRKHLRQPAGKAALDYLHGRGLTDETIALFELGYAPAGWDNLLKYFTEQGRTEQELLEAGLLSERDKGGVYDRFRHRIMFPIRDERGRMAGFGARALNPDDVPKYLNSPQTPVFDKSALLYGLDKARKPIREKDQVVIVEGYMDVIAPVQAGFTNLVSPMGTALTEAQLKLLKRLTRRMVLALDADAAGANATLRGLNVARNTLDREADPTFNARGLVSFEGRLQADIRVTTLPDGQDPDEVVQKDRAQWEALIAAAKPVVEHVMETLAAGQNLDDAKIKTDIAAQVMPLIRDVPSAIERDTYIQKLARLIRVDERTLMQEAGMRATGQRPPVKRQPAQRGASAPAVEERSPASAAANSIAKLEGHILSVILRQPELLYKIDRALQESGLTRIAAQDFQLTNHQVTFGLALESLEQDHTEPLNFAMENLPLPLFDMVDDFLEDSEDLDPAADRVLEDLLRAILQLRLKHLRQSSDQLRFLQEAAHELGDLKATQYAQTLLQITRNLDLINRALGRFGNVSIAIH